MHAFESGRVEPRPRLFLRTSTKQPDARPRIARPPPNLSQAKQRQRWVSFETPVALRLGLSTPRSTTPPMLLPAQGGGGSGALFRRFWQLANRLHAAVPWSKSSHAPSCLQPTPR